jgi:hypothetical protein
MTTTFDNIPDELKAFRQWIVWRFEDHGGPKPTKVPYAPNFPGHAAVDKPGSWGSFDEAVLRYGKGGVDGIGFVLTEADPFVFVDLDDTHGNDEALQTQYRIFHEFQSYAERSPSGNGLHIIGKAKLPGKGRKRNYVEVYDRSRYMTMTGDVYRDEAINDVQDAAALLWHQMGGPAAIHHYEGDQPQREDDNAIIDRARNAVNGHKFTMLFEGDWSRDYNDDWSAADQAFVDIVAFYTQNRAQITRIWGYSQLGKRDKFNKRPDYITFTINRAFDRLLPQVDTEGLMIQLRAQLEAKVEQEPEIPGLIVISGNENGATTEGPIAAPLPSSLIPHDKGSDAPPGRDAITASDVVSQDGGIVNGGLTIIPPGLVGAVADFIYEAAPRPVREIALVGAIGFVAGIVGRAFNVSGTGLNLYTLCLAPTGTGKEAINAGISKLISAVRPSCQTIDDFVGPAEIRSDAALLKWIAKHPCFLSVTGEFGLRLKQMSAPNASPSEVGLKRVLLDLYNKSGHGNALNPIAYSDKEKNTAAIASPAFSMIGETTPERFYEVLDESMVAEGLLPRFLTIEYDGKRPASSKTHGWAQPSLALIEMVQQIVVHVQTIMAKSGVQTVNVDPYAQQLFEDFDRYCDDQINADNSREVVRHMWNRAHIKALKLAALVAVGIAPYDPVIDRECAAWATDLVVRDVTNIINRFERGDVGSGTGANEQRQVGDVVKIIRDWVSSSPELSGKYGMPPHMHKDGVISYSALSKRCLQLASFRNDRMGSTNALKRTLQMLLDSDDIRELPKSQMTDKYQTNGRGFAISNPATFIKLR